MIRILFLAANPLSTERLRLDQEIREIQEGLHRANMRDKFVLEQRWAVRPLDIHRAILDIEPQIVHFSGHGVGEEGIVLENTNGEPQIVTTEGLSSLFELFPDITCVVLNACYSEKQAVAISEHIQHIVGMSSALPDWAAIDFAVAFYDALGAGRSIDFAHKLGCAAIKLSNVSAGSIPVLMSQLHAGKTAGQPSPLESSADAHLLHAFPRGPLVPVYLIKRQLKAAYAASIDPTEAHAVISDANALRREADPEDPAVTVISLANLPPPLSVRPTAFWEAAFGEACLHGPRMLAALLHAVPEHQFPDDARTARATLLDKLRSS